MPCSLLFCKIVKFIPSDFADMDRICRQLSQYIRERLRRRRVGLSVSGTARSLSVCGPRPARMLSKIPSLSCKVGREVVQPGYPKDKRDRPNTAYPLEIWSGRGDLNTRHPAPKAGALPVCATPRRRGFSLLQLSAQGKQASGRTPGILGGGRPSPASQAVESARGVGRHRRQCYGSPTPAMAAPQAPQRPSTVRAAVSPMPSRSISRSPQPGQ